MSLERLLRGVDVPEAIKDEIRKYVASERNRITRQGEMTRKVIRIFSESGDVRDTLQRVLSVVVAWGNFDAGCIYLYNGEHDPCLVHEGFSEEFLRDTNLLLQPDSIDAHQQYASIAVIPIISTQETIGFIQFNAIVRDRFTEEIVQLFKNLASHTAEFLSRKRQLTDTKNATAFSALRLKEILQGSIIQTKISWKDEMEKSGKGATIEIRLPYGTREAKLISRSAPIIPADIRILWVDDEEAICRCGKRALSRLGYAVDYATSGKDAITLFSQNRYDLLITAIGMPEMDGWQLAKAARELQPKLKIATVSNWSAENFSAEKEKYGVRHVFEKPLPWQEVRHVVQEILQQP